MKSQLNNALAFFQVVAIITNLSTFAGAKIHLFIQIAKKKSVAANGNALCVFFYIFY